MTNNINDMDEEEYMLLYTWVDEIPLSRQKKNIARDFSDGVLMAEVVHHFFPRIVQLHNYSAASSVEKKLYNWATLNRKVFKKLDFQLSREEMEEVAKGVPGAIERILKAFQIKVHQIQAQGGLKKTTPTQRKKRVTERRSRNISHESSYDDDSRNESEKRGLQTSEESSRIAELEQTVKTLENKIEKLTLLIKLKDAKIKKYQDTLREAGLLPNM